MTIVEGKVVEEMADEVKTGVDEEVQRVGFGDVLLGNEGLEVEGLGVEGLGVDSLGVAGCEVEGLAVECLEVEDLGNKVVAADDSVVSLTVDDISVDLAVVAAVLKFTSLSLLHVLQQRRQKSGRAQYRFRASIRQNTDRSP